MGTIQLDFQLPGRFDLSYVDEDGSKKCPIMVHRAIFGSFDRFIGIITEHFAGHFPTWISPIQARVIPVSEKALEYAKTIADKLDELNVKVELDDSNERIGYKIRSAQLQRIPYMIILGENEMNNGTVSVRKRNGEEIKDLSFEAVQSLILEDINLKKISG